MKYPLISVIIPVYNPGMHLVKCLESVCNQTYSNLEIILVDDGSKDDSLKVCMKYAQSDSRIIVQHQENKGVSAARNAGIKLSHGDYYSFIDSDDYLEMDCYEYLLKIVQEQHCDAVNFEYFITYTDHEICHQLPEENYGLKNREQAMYQLVYNVAFAWNKFFSRELVEGLLFDTEIARGEDSLFARQAFDRAYSVYFEKRPLLHYVQSEDSAVRGKFRKIQLSALKLYEASYPFFSEKYPQLLGKWIQNMGELLISLYYDMYIDSEDFSAEMKTVKKIYNTYYNEAIEFKKSSRKVKLKLRIFKFSPMLYCWIHKMINDKS